MRVLCLHGKGTSGSIFRSQTSSFRSQISKKDIEFDWVDGPLDSNAAPGIDLFYPPPYYSFMDNTIPADTYAGINWLRGYIEQHGPYDVVMGFSQGNVLASAYLLVHELETPHLPLPFKAAIFHCGGLSLPFMTELGFIITPEIRQRDEQSRMALGVMASSEAILQGGGKRWQGDFSEKGLSEEDIRDEIKGPVQISIPTVHIYGSKDPRFLAGLQLSGACNAENRRVFNHGGGHEIPRTSVVSNAIAELFDWAIDQAA
ncbi:hypothetical protein N7540_004298 [Penicillium herquei]|nr:hypothetical protein N7540_004298 [Penicillium herquei]